METEANKQFFNKLGWDNFPKHISAIPIKSEKKVLDKVFVGLSTKTLSKQSIQKIEKVISDFFTSNQKELAEAA